MKIFKTISVAFLFFLVTDLWGQQSVYRDKFTEGNFLLLEDNFPMALKNYKEAYAIDSTNANINYKMGFCYIKTNTNKTKALKHLELASTDVTEKYNDFEPREKGAPVTTYYYLGIAYHLNNRFNDALKMFEKYKTYLKSKKQAEIIKETDGRIAQVKNAIEFYANPVPVRINNISDSINTAYAEYSPVISADESMLFFTSRREGSTGGEKTSDDQFYEDIYVSYKKEDGTWSAPFNDPNINTTDHEATVGLSADGQQLFIYKDEDIYVSTLDGERWSLPEKVGADGISDINTTAWEPSACITADGRTLYFSSDRKGGYGGTDIYQAVKLPNGKWSKARNLGPIINTALDEDGPYIHPNATTLYFSSKGHKNMGGFDIFSATLGDSARWSEPVNIGAPVNTPDDDIFYMTSPDGKRAYYSSSKDGGYGDKDIYMIIHDEPVKTTPVALVLGFIKSGTDEPIPASNEIIVTDNESGEISFYRARVRDGKFVISLNPGADYTISYKVDGEEFKSETLSVPKGDDYREIKREIYIKEPVAKPVVPAVVAPPKDTAAVVIEKPKDTKTKTKKTKTSKSGVTEEMKNKLASVSGRRFQMNFKYNVRAIDPNNASFKTFIDTIASVVSQKGTAEITIFASASRVPTRMYGSSNKQLSKARAESSKAQVIEALKEKGIDESKLTFKVSSIVGGPAYNEDYKIKRSVYEKHQFVKISIGQ